MSLIFRTVHAWSTFFGGETGPSGLMEKRYLEASVPDGGSVIDVGGGEGKLAKQLAHKARSVIVLDREQTSREGADNSIYQGSLQRLQERAGHKFSIIPVMGDATEFPMREASADAIVSSQLLEHLDAEAQRRFFVESARCLKPGGTLSISTPDGDFMDHHIFHLSRRWRQRLSAETIRKLPRSLQGPWLVESVEEWETRVGHYGHGCRVEELRKFAREAGLVEIDRRATHTAITAFWLEMNFTFPLIAMIATPLVRVLYEIESRRKPTPGINLLIRFQKPLAHEIHGEK